MAEPPDFADKEVYRGEIEWPGDTHVAWLEPRFLWCERVDRKQRLELFGPARIRPTSLKRDCRPVALCKYAMVGTTVHGVIDGSP